MVNEEKSTGKMKKIKKYLHQESETC